MLAGLRWLRRKERGAVAPVPLDRVDLEAPSVVDLVDESSSTARTHLHLSLLAAPEQADRLAQALWLVSGDRQFDATGMLLPVGPRPHRLGPDDVAATFVAAHAAGVLQDGFLEIDATVDLRERTVRWYPDAIDPHLPSGFDPSQVDGLGLLVDNAVAALVETDLLGTWFAPTSVAPASSLAALCPARAEGSAPTVDITTAPAPER